MPSYRAYSGMPTTLSSPTPPAPPAYHPPPGPAWAKTAISDFFNMA